MEVCALKQHQIASNWCTMLQRWFCSRPGLLYAIRHERSENAQQMRQYGMHPSYEQICHFVRRLLDVMCKRHASTHDAGKAAVAIAPVQQQTSISPEQCAKLALAYLDDYIAVCSLPLSGHAHRDPDIDWQHFADRFKKTAEDASMAPIASIPEQQQNASIDSRAAHFNTFQLLRASVACSIISVKMYFPHFKLNTACVARQVQSLLLGEKVFSSIGRSYTGTSERKLSDRRRHGKLVFDAERKNFVWTWQNSSRTMRNISIQGHLFGDRELLLAERDVLNKLQWNVLPQKYELTP